MSGRSLELTRRATPTLVDRLPDSVRLFYAYRPKVSPNDEPAP